MPYRIEVSNLRPVPNSGAVRAFADVDIGGKLTIYGCKVVQDGDKRPWVAFDRPYTGPAGQTCYSPTVRIIDPALKEAVTEAVLRAWKEGQP
jgi:DNA-binding cell septation regulator SpoVG